MDDNKKAAAVLRERAAGIRNSVVLYKEKQLQIIDSIIQMAQVEHEAISAEIQRLEPSLGALGVNVPVSAGVPDGPPVGTGPEPKAPEPAPPEA